MYDTADSITPNKMLTEKMSLFKVTVNWLTRCLQISHCQWGYRSPVHTQCTSTPLSSCGIPSRTPLFSFRYTQILVWTGGAANTCTANVGVLKPALSSQVNCISTEFTPRKHGGEKGVPFRIQVDTFTSNEHGEYLEHVHSSSCQVKVFKVGERSYLYVYLYECIFDIYI